MILYVCVSVCIHIHSYIHAFMHAYTHTYPTHNEYQSDVIGVVGVQL